MLSYFCQAFGLRGQGTEINKQMDLTEKNNKKKQLSFEIENFLCPVIMGSNAIAIAIIRMRFSKKAKYYFHKGTLIPTDWMEVESRGD